MPVDPASITLRDLAIGDAGWLVQRHAELYAEAERFDASFEPLVADTLVDFLRNADPATERAFIAQAGGRRLGSIFCVQSGAPGIAKLRLFLLEPEARGLGLGQRLLDACLGFARDVGYRKMRLSTHESHKAACALYAKNEFRLISASKVHSFGIDLVEQSWEIDLS
ncbi:MAG: GNAT family N-acetyltransferase [Pseudomonadota bacterium]